MKLSVSLSDEDVAVLDRYADAAGLSSRSAAIQRAIRMLGDPENWTTPTPPRGRSGRRLETPPIGRPPSPTGSPMLRGEIRLTDLAQGSEAGKRRPAVLVSNDRPTPLPPDWLAAWSPWFRSRATLPTSSHSRCCCQPTRPGCPWTPKRNANRSARCRGTGWALPSGTSRLT